MAGKRRAWRELAIPLGMALAGACFVAASVRRFWVRPEHFGLASVLGCAAGVFAGFLILLICDYLLHHAPLVFIPWVLCVIYFAIFQPHFGMGLGLSIWCLLASNLRG